jgi:hypothetical protein
MATENDERLSLAKSMLKRTNEGDAASANTIWRQQHASVREMWLRRADAVIEDLEADGLRLAPPAP